MKYVVVGMRDKVAQRFEGINLDVNADVARRNFSFAVNNSNDLLFKAKDLELYKLAEFDLADGSFDVLVPMELICRADEVISHE